MNERTSFTSAITPPAKPAHFEQMLALAEALADKFPQVRIDFYETPDGRVLFGEYTFYHWSGFVPFDPDQADAAILRGEPGALLTITIAPEEPGAKTVCYKMLIAADTHELLSFERSRYKDPSDGRFTDAEAKRFERRGATVIR